MRSTFHIKAAINQFKPRPQHTKKVINQNPNTKKNRYKPTPQHKKNAINQYTQHTKKRKKTQKNPKKNSKKTKKKPKKTTNKNTKQKTDNLTKIDKKEPSKQQTYLDVLNRAVRRRLRRKGHGNYKQPGQRCAAVQLRRAEVVETDQRCQQHYA